MDILNIKSRLEKWEQLTNDFSPNFKAGEKQSFKLIPYHATFKQLFEITGIYHVTTKDTDFILDTEIKSIAQLETNGNTPKAGELYNVYLQARREWLDIMLHEAVKRRLNSLVLTNMPAPPFEILKRYLDETIYNSVAN